MSFVLRNARPNDYTHFVRLFPELRTDDPMRTQAQFETDIMPTMLLAEQDGEINAYVYYQLLADTAYVRHLVVAPGARRQGLGKKLLDAVKQRGLEKSLEKFCLNVLPTNAPAVALYESYGMRAVYTMIVVRIPWDAPSLVGGAPASARAMLPSDDARIETRFAVVPGLLADLRGRGRVCIVIEEDGDIVAGVAFDPAYPGTPVFRAARADLALPLARALVPHRRAEHAWVQIVCEGQADVAAALVDAGAREHLRTLHYRMSL
jgi:GNAT superfamily N-acetyltransferase